MFLGAVRRRSVCSSTPPAPRAITVDDVFEIHDVRDPQITEDGKWVAYTVATASLKEDKTETRIWMAPAGGGDAIVMTAEDVSSSHPRWSPDGKYLAFLSKAERRQDAGVAAQPHGRRGAEAVRIRFRMWMILPGLRTVSGSCSMLQDPSPEELDEAKTKGDKDKPGSNDKETKTSKTRSQDNRKPASVGDGSLSLQDRHSWVSRPSPDSFICV